MFRVLIADDHPLFRSALRQVIEGMFSEFEIFEASTLDEALHVAGGADLDLDVILLDLQMPGSSGFSGLVTLRNAAPSVPIVVVSAATSDEIMRSSITYGASGFIPKSFSKDMIGQAMSKVMDGEVFLPDELDRLSGLHLGIPEKLGERLSALTQGELRVLELLAKGKSNKIIAYELGIKESTVKAHITAILRKLRVHNRTQAVIAARELDFSHS
jgi:DNA-binding NarL/FixJ family response regulator